MQDIHSIGGGGRLFSGVGGDRRLRPHNHQNNQALKCPRCDSLNTKFCYYNNYNLSQPRHFCKSCRRYWTKGGVLRNVPVGGGCRKTKRSKPKQPTSASDATTNTTATTTTTTPAQAQEQQEQQRERKSSNSHSSSESSSLTATNTTTNTAVEAVSSSSNNNIMNGIGESKMFVNGNMNPTAGLESGLLEQASDCGIFSEIGSFTSLITSTNEPLPPFGFNSILNHQQSSESQVQQNQNQQWQQQQQQQQQHHLGEEMGAGGGLIDQTVNVELSALQNSRSSGNGGFGSLDWQVTGDPQGLFDFPNPVDQAYWSQCTHWTDQDHSNLYLP